MAIAIVVLLFVVYFMVTTAPQTVSGWELSSTDRVRHMTVGDNDTLYAFRDDGIYSIDRNGNLMWDFHVPEKWSILNTWERHVYASGTTGTSKTVESSPISDAEAGYLYVFAMPDATVDSLKMQYYQNMSPYLTLEAAVLAISPNGKLEWTLPVSLEIPASDVLRQADSSPLKITRTVAVHASGDRIYIFHDYTETVVDRQGNILFELTDVSSPASVDEAGNIFIVRAEKPGTTQASSSSGYVSFNLELDPDYMVPSGIVEGYAPDGSLIWSRDFHDNVIPQSVVEDIWPEYNCLPIYQNGTLYVALDNYVLALDHLGRTKWLKNLPGGPYVMFELMPIDAQGNVYMRSLTPATSGSYVTVIDPDGWIHTAPWQYDSRYDTLRHTAASDGVVYNINNVDYTQVKSLKDLQTLSITAYDVKNSTALWSYTMPVDRVNTVLLNSSNVDDILNPYGISYYNPLKYSTPTTYGTAAGSLRPAGWPEISIYPGSDVIYVSYRSINYETPLTLNQSKAIFSSGIYALDTSGGLKWRKDLHTAVTSATANNSTIYYSTTDGRIFGTTVNTIVGGIAISAMAAALLLKFFAIGTVSRARDRLDKNDNRNLVLQYIVRNPGVTAVDIARDMGLNVGTVRYHLLILGINHKIVEHKDDKYLRYFTNSNTYSLTERTIVSLMKREPMWRVLSALADKPGLSNAEISREMNISTGAASRHMNELLQKGVVTKTPQGGGYAYSIKDDYRQYVVKMMERL